MRKFFLLFCLLGMLPGGGWSQSSPSGKAVINRLAEQAKDPAYRSVAQKVFLSKTSAAARALEAGKRTEPEVGSRALASLEKKIAHLQRENAALKAQLARWEWNDNLQGAVFLAMNKRGQAEPKFSGTVFKTVYNGKEEVFGVIAAHSIELADFPMDALHKRFLVSMQIEGQQRVFPVEIVQLSSPGLMDLALVKFRPEDEKLLTPLSIQTQVGEKDNLFSQGFALAQKKAFPRKMVGRSNFSFKTTMPLPREDRSGFCGSPVLNDKQELVGIHSGSVFYDSGDVGFAIPAKFLNVLVQAYHNGGEAKIPLLVNEHKLADVNLDEYVTSVDLYDARMHSLRREEFSFKFSHVRVEKALAAYPETRYIVTTTHRVYWKDSSGRGIVENRSYNDKTKKYYKYDLKTGQVSNIRPNF